MLTPSEEGREKKRWVNEGEERREHTSYTGERRHRISVAMKKPKVGGTESWLR